MTTRLIARTAAALAIAAGFCSAAQATEPTLTSILGSGYTKIGTSADYSFADVHAGAGTKIDFTLLNESTAWNATQTFGIKEGSTSVGIFSGAATNGAKAHVTLASMLTGVSFNSNSGNAQQYAPGGSLADFWVYRSNTNSNVYALAYEDYLVPGAIDHNDMVVQMSVSAVPEPQTYALLLAGLGVVVTLSRRRRA